MRSIVVGVDGSEASVRALEFAAQLASDVGDAELVVTYARHISSLWLPDNVADDEFADVLDQTEWLVRDAAAKALKDRPTLWRLEVAEGEPSSVLRDTAGVCGSSSIIVVGRSGWSTARELLLGSVSNRLAHHGDYPVLLV
jgi:nucleotide-binding universal stress UspA family protein